MDWWSTLQALVLLVAGAGITLLTTWLAGQAQARARAIEVKRDQQVRTWTIGRDHALAARTTALFLREQVLRAKDSGRNAFQFASEEISALGTQVALVPDDQIRWRVNVTLGALQRPVDYAPIPRATAQPLLFQYELLCGYVEALEAFVREENQDDRSFLGEVADETNRAFVERWRLKHGSD